MQYELIKSVNFCQKPEKEYTFSMKQHASFLDNIRELSPEYVNTEYVHPCKVDKQVYISPLSKNHPGLKKYIKDHLQTVVTPYGVE